MKKLYLTTALISLSACLAPVYAANGYGETTRQPILSVTVERAILCFDPAKADQAKTTISAAPLNFPEGAHLTYEWKQVQDEMLPAAAIMAKKPIRFSVTNKPSTVATFPANGVYEVQVTVTDARTKKMASRNTWINVWDNKPALVVDGKPDPLTVIPGMKPPKVRNIAPEPGPFVHPRLLCSPGDWKDIHARAVDGQSKIAAAGWKSISDKFKLGVDPNGADGKFLTQVEAYADAGFTGKAPDLIEVNISGLLENLSNACFVAWLKVDPSQPLYKLPPKDQELRKKLAKQVAGISRFLLDNSWDRKTGQFKKDALGYITNLETPGARVPDSYPKLAIAYDFSAPWMSPDQLRDTRNLLIAMGRGRKGPGQDRGSAKNRDVERGWEQNGTFGVWGEQMIMLSLVVAGEESGADPLVVKTFLNPPKPNEYEKQKKAEGYDLVRPVEFDGGGPLPVSRPYPPAISWPNALKSDVNWLQKQIFTYQDGMISPWGFTLERLAYFGYMANETWPSAYIFARFGGFNQYVASDFYQTVNNWIYTMYPSGGPNKSDSFLSNVGIYEHHSGGGDYRQQWILFLKHMYPEDTVVDYAYAAQAPDLEKRSLNPIHSCIFGVDPKIKDLAGAMEPVAKQGDLPLTKLDPDLGITVMRSGWKDDDQMLYFNGGHRSWGHMNAENGSFAFFALGRHWAVPSGYHKVLGNFQSLVQVQNPDWAACPITKGYMTENPCFKPDVPNCDYNSGFPTPPAHLLEVREAPDRQWSLAAVDMTVAYNYTCGNPNKTAVEVDIRDFMYAGLNDFRGRIDPEYAQGWKAKIFPVPDSSTIQHAIRTILFVRGSRPYCLVVDDFQKNDKPANYRWVMNNKTKMKDEGRAVDNKDESFCVVMSQGATTTDAVLLHRRDEGDQPGLPRLLVRDLSENDNGKQPALRMEQSVFNLPDKSYSREEVNSLFIERNNVVNPNYKVLLFPYRSGEKLPVTSWNETKNELKIDLLNGTVDTITFDRSNPDHRTRVSLKRVKANGP